MNLPYQDVTLSTADGMHLAAWYVPGRQLNAVILVHGIHANRQATLPAAVMLFEAGYHVLMLDLRGHGDSEGEQVSYGFYESLDVQAGVSYLLAKKEIEHVGAIGYSLGGAAVAQAAASDERLQAVVIQSSFSSLADAVDDSFAEYTKWPKWPFAPIVINAAETELGVTVEEIDSAHALASVSPRPVLIIHGSDDKLFPVHQAFKLYQTAKAPKGLWVIEGMGHEYPFAYKREYQQRVLAFFNEAFAR
jgi:alpha-beta hydrolase superfamily lysophospholipase